MTVTLPWRDYVDLANKSIDVANSLGELRKDLDALRFNRNVERDFIPLVLKSLEATETNLRANHFQPPVAGT